MSMQDTAYVPQIFNQDHEKVHRDYIESILLDKFSMKHEVALYDPFYKKEMRADLMAWPDEDALDLGFYDGSFLIEVKTLKPATEGCNLAELDGDHCKKIGQAICQCIAYSRCIIKETGKKPMFTLLYIAGLENASKITQRELALFLRLATNQGVGQLKINGENWYSMNFANTDYYSCRDNFREHVTDSHVGTYRQLGTKSKQIHFENGGS